MTKPELISQIAERTGMKKVDVTRALQATLDVITDALRKKQEVSLVGFGTFGVRTRAARVGRNPRTGQRINIPKSSRPVFRPGKRLREAVAK